VTADYRPALVAILLVCLLVGSLVSAGQAQQTADFLIRNARIIDGTGRVLENGSLSIRGDRIITVSPETLDIRASVEIDATGLTVMPGLVDAHRHLLIEDKLDSDAALERWRTEHLAAMLRSYLESGITTVLSAGDYHPAIIEIKQHLADGSLSGPRLLALSPVFTAPGGHPVVTICNENPWCQNRVALQFADAEAARAKVKDLVKADIDGLKLIYDGRLGAKLADEVFAAIAEEARRQKVPVFAHASTVEDMIRAVELGANRLVHPPYFGTLARRDTGRKLRAESVLLTTTVSRPLGLEYRDRLQALANLRQLWDEGVTVAFGTDTQATPSAGLSSEIGLLSQEFSPAEIISALTRNAAMFLGLETEIGTLEAGKLADILFVDGDPLAAIEDLARVALVIRGGIIVVDRR